MRTSHRKGVSMIQEYGLISGNKLKKQISDSVKKSLIGIFYYHCCNCQIRFESSFRLSNKKKYCSDNCRIQAGVFTENTCCVCNFLVKRTNTKSKNTFCSRDCYFQWKRQNPQLSPPQSLARLEAMKRPETKLKARSTRIANGHQIDFRVLKNWKKFQIKCDELVRLLKKELIKDWDGYDAIDGKYIKDNLSLPFTHGDYPSLDHIRPRILFFKEGLTPEEAIIPNNLQWTTRRNNSIKKNKYLIRKKFKSYSIKQTSIV